jgi:hypothetical protein
MCGQLFVGMEIFWLLIFFDVNVTGEIYLNMINEQVVPEMREVFDYNLYDEALFRGLWWFQDGAGAHRSEGHCVLRVYRRVRSNFLVLTCSLGQN